MQKKDKIIIGATERSKVVFEIVAQIHMQRDDERVAGITDFCEGGNTRFESIISTAVDKG